MAQAIHSLASVLTAKKVKKLRRKLEICNLSDTFSWKNQKSLLIGSNMAFEESQAQHDNNQCHSGRKQKPSFWNYTGSFVGATLKIVAVFSLLLGLSELAPFGIKGEVKAFIASLYGVTGAVYYEVGPNGNADFYSPGPTSDDTELSDDDMDNLMRKCSAVSSSEEREEAGCAVFGGLFLLREGNREFCDIRRGDILQASTQKNFRSLAPNGDSNPENGGTHTARCEPPLLTDREQTAISGYSSHPKIFVLEAGQCVVVLGSIGEASTTFAMSGGWLRVATTSCGLFR